MTFTTIHCTTCTSTVPWGPHCPECGAYLEFAGDPPWRPEPPDLVREAPVIDTSVDATPLTPVMIETITVAEERPEHQQPVAVQQSLHRRSYLGTLTVLVAGAVITPIMWWVAGQIIGVMTGVVFLVWATVLWPARKAPALAAPPATAPEVTPAVHPAQVMAEVTIQEEPPQVQARAPQSLPHRVIESTRTLVLVEPEGSVPCLTCTRLNTDDRHYCAWCGGVLPETFIAPSTTAVEPTPATNAGGGPKRRRRRLSRSWRTPIMVLTLGGVLLGAIAVSLFGPGAFQVRFGMTTVYQLINQFIDPYAAGMPVDVEEVTATSSTRGVSPQNVLGPDATTFWVSSPSSTQGAGTQLLFTFSGAYTINRMVILPGIQNGVFDVRGVATPHEITLTFDDGSTVEAELELIQTDGDLQQLVHFPKVTTKTVLLTIDSVYPPRTPSSEMVSEVAISGVRFLTPPVPPQIIKLPTDVQPRDSLPGTT